MTICNYWCVCTGSKLPGVTDSYWGSAVVLWFLSVIACFSRKMHDFRGNIFRSWFEGIIQVLSAKKKVIFGDCQCRSNCCFRSWNVFQCSFAQTIFFCFVFGIVGAGFIRGKRCQAQGATGCAGQKQTIATGSTTFEVATFLSLFISIIITCLFCVLTNIKIQTHDNYCMFNLAMFHLQLLWISLEKGIKRLAWHSKTYNLPLGIPAWNSIF